MIKHHRLLSAALLGSVTIAATVVVTPSPAAAVEVCGTFDTVDVNNREYVVQNNVWGASTAQCIDVPEANATSFRVTRSDHDNATNGAPASYPSIFEGCHWNDCTAGSELPLQVDTIGRADTTWDVTAEADGAWNVAYDLWFKSDPAPGPPDGAELMIWLDSQGGVQPAGSIVAGDVPIADATWNVWQAQMGWNYIAYQRTSPTGSAEFDLHEFIIDAVARGAVQPSWYLVTVEAGFELWRAGAGLATNSFSFTGSPAESCEVPETV
jgi:hypothetical protein